MCKKDYSWNPSTCTCDVSRYIKSFVDDSVFVSNNIINVAGTVSTNVTNTVPTNVTRTVSISSDNKNVSHKMLFFAHV